MEKTDFTIRNINQNLAERLQKENLDFCKMIVQAYDEDLSVTAKYDPPEQCVSLSGNVDPDRFYYGASPRLDGREIIRAISNLELQSADGLHSYLDDHDDWFMMHPNQSEYLYAMAEYIVISMASHFGIRLGVEKDAFADLQTYLTECGYSCAEVSSLLSYDQNGEQPYLTIRGCPTEELLSYLSRFSYQVKTVFKKGEPVERKSEELEVWVMQNADLPEEKKPEAEVRSIREIYADRVRLVEGRVFYSGVLLRPTQLEIIDKSGENEQIRSLCIHFERSTYGTVCALDNNLTDHPALHKVRNLLVKMLREDDRKKTELYQRIAETESSELSESETSEQMIAAINQYLKTCFNVNQIGVSANIVTSDGMLLLGQRSRSNIDAGKLYPGVNGNAEIADKSVSFYSLSVYEDYPTIHIEDDRIDFFGEIGRETYGEMKVDLPKQEWICYGVILSGNMPKETAASDSYRETGRRMHFNLIFEHSTENTFQEIESISIRAAEAFETNRYLGIHVKCEKSRLEYIWKTAGRMIVGIVGHKDFIEAIAAIVLFLLTIARIVFAAETSPASLYQKLSELEWTEALALLLSFLLVAVTAANIIGRLFFFFHRRRKIRRIRLYLKMSYRDVNERVSAALHMPGRTGNEYSLHPAAYACLRAFVDNRLYDTFFPKDRR